VVRVSPEKAGKPSGIKGSGLFYFSTCLVALSNSGPAHNRVCGMRTSGSACVRRGASIITAARPIARPQGLRGSRTCRVRDSIPEGCIRRRWSGRTRDPRPSQRTTPAH